MYVILQNFNVLRGNCGATDRRIRHVGVGELVGGSDLDRLSEWRAKSNADVKALCSCDLQVIKVDTLFSCLRLYPEFAVKFSERLPNHLAFDLTSRVWFPKTRFLIKYTGRSFKTLEPVK